MRSLGGWVPQKVAKAIESNIILVSRVGDIGL